MNAQTRLQVRQVSAEYLHGDAYELSVDGHRYVVDQPLADGGADTGASPLALFVGSVAACMAHFAGRFMERHGIDRRGLAVVASYGMADHPRRVAHIHVRLTLPDRFPADRVPALRAVVSRCTVGNSLRLPPQVDLVIDGEPSLHAD